MPDTDENITPTTEEGKDTEQDADKGDGLGEGGQKALAAERDARKAAEKQARDNQKVIDDLAAKVKGFEDRDKSETEKTADRIAELEKALADKDSELSKKDLAVLRTKIANREGKHVPVDALTGTTEEELIECADRLLEWRKPTPGAPPIRQTGPRSGAGAPPDGSNPKSKAAAAIRAMRAGQ